MTQDALFLVAVAVIAGYMMRLALKLAPLTSEFPLKTLFATLLSVAVALADILPYHVGDDLRLLALIVGPLYAFGPLLSVGLARIRRYRLAATLISILYWTQDGRSAVSRLPAQVALQRGDVNEALELIPEADQIMLAQAYALREEWERIVGLDLPTEGDRSFMGDAVRIEALLHLDRREEARRALERLRTRWESGPQGPLGYRSLRLSEARLAAERGDLAALRDFLGQPLPGVPAHLMLALLARGAESAQRHEEAGNLYQRAYSAAPEALRSRYARRLHALGFETPPPVAATGRPTATYSLAGGLVLAFLAQLWLNAAVGPLAAGGTSFEASSLAAGFLLGLPTLPEAGAWWRYLSYSMIHGHLVHIGFNIWVLLELGRTYEARAGKENLIASFVLGTAMGALITAIAHDTGPLVLLGASGGVLGIAGALLGDTLAGRNGADRALAGGLLRWMGLIALLSVAIPNVSLWGHVGGVVGGLLWGFLRLGLPPGRAIDAAAAAISMALLVVALFHSAALAMRLVNL